MEPKFQSSFIPKGPVASANPLMPAARSNRTFLGTIAVFAFVVSLLLAGAVFGYGRYLLSHIGTLGGDLNQAKAALQPDVIAELVSTNTRISSTRQLLQKHVSLSPFFDFLEASTLKNVRFNDFNYTADTKGVIALSMKGQARSYGDVAQQSDTFAKSSFLKDPLFSDLGLDEKGNVTFSFSATIDASAVSYQKRFEGQPAASQTVISPSASSTSAVATSTATTTRPVTATTTPKTATTTRPASTTPTR